MNCRTSNNTFPADNLDISSAYNHAVASRPHYDRKNHNVRLPLQKDDVIVRPKTVPLPPVPYLVTGLKYFHPRQDPLREVHENLFLPFLQGHMQSASRSFSNITFEIPVAAAISFTSTCQGRLVTSTCPSNTGPATPRHILSG